MLYFIWVFTVCKSIRLWVFEYEGLKFLENCIYCDLLTLCSKVLLFSVIVTIERDVSLSYKLNNLNFDEAFRDKFSSKYKQLEENMLKLVSLTNGHTYFLAN